MKTYIAANGSTPEVAFDFGSIALSPGDKFIRLPEVLAMTGLTKSVLYQAISECTFPQPVKLGTGMTAAGMTGSGAGIGAAAGPVGIAAGALVGLACYGVYRLFKD